MSLPRSVRRGGVLLELRLVCDEDLFFRRMSTGEWLGSRFHLSRPLNRWALNPLLRREPERDRDLLRPEDLDLDRLLRRPGERDLDLFLFGDLDLERFDRVLDLDRDFFFREGVRDFFFLLRDEDLDFFSLAGDLDFDLRFFEVDLEERFLTGEPDVERLLLLGDLEPFLETVSSPSFSAGFVFTAASSSGTEESIGDDEGSPELGFSSEPSSLEGTMVVVCSWADSSVLADVPVAGTPRRGTGFHPPLGRASVAPALPCSVLPVAFSSPIPWSAAGFSGVSEETLVSEESVLGFSAVLSEDRDLDLDRDFDLDLDRDLVRFLERGEGDRERDLPEDLDRDLDLDLRGE